MCNEYPDSIEMSKDIPTIITYGQQSADYTGLPLADSALLSVKVTNQEGIGQIDSQLVGAYNFQIDGCRCCWTALWGYPLKR